MTADITKGKVKVKSLSRVRLSATPWTVAYHAPPSMEFSRQEYWSGLPFQVTLNTACVSGPECFQILTHLALPSTSTQLT